MSVDLNRQLLEYCRQMDETQAAISLDDILERRGNRQVIPEPSRRRTSPPRKWFAAVPVALAILILALGLWVFRRVDDTPQPADQPTVTTVPETRGPSVDRRSSGSFDTPLGETAWWHVDGNPGSLPAPTHGLVETPTGFLAIESGTGLESPIYWSSVDGLDWAASQLPNAIRATEARLKAAGGAFWMTTGGPTTLWRSEDGQTWSQVPIPPGAESSSVNSLEIFEVNGATWLITGTPPGAWLEDGSSWVEIDTDAVTPPQIAGGRWRASPGAPVLHASTTIIPWYLTFGVDWASLLGIDPQRIPYAAWDPESQTLGIWGLTDLPRELPNYQMTELVTLDFELSGDRIVLRDSESRELVHEVIVTDPRIDPLTLLEASLRIGEYRMTVVDEDGVVTPATAPWGAPAWGWGLAGRNAAVLFAGEQFVALVKHVNPPGGEMTAEVWTSTDGIEWSGPEQPAFIDPQQPPVFLDIGFEGGMARVEVHGLGTYETWVTSDGSDWTATHIVGGADYLALALPGSGGEMYWSISVIQSGETNVYVSPDQRTWYLVDTGGIDFNATMFDGADAGWSRWYAAGGAAFHITVIGDGASREMYILKPQP